MISGTKNGLSRKPVALGEDKVLFADIQETWKGTHAHR